MAVLPLHAMTETHKHVNKVISNSIKIRFLHFAHFQEAFGKPFPHLVVNFYTSYLLLNEHRKHSCLCVVHVKLLG